MMKRVLATLAMATMLVSVPTAAMAGKPDKGNNNGDCSPRGANKGGTCNTTGGGGTGGNTTGDQVDACDGQLNGVVVVGGVCLNFDVVAPVTVTV